MRPSARGFHSAKRVEEGVDIVVVFVCNGVTNGADFVDDGVVNHVGFSVILVGPQLTEPERLLFQYVNSIPINILQKLPLSFVWALLFAP